MIVDPHLIETLPELQRICNEMLREEVLAVDLEADSLHHYFPKVCLIQISTERQTFIIDPLAVPNIDALRPLLSNSRIKKVLHGADYDLRSLWRDYSMKVENLFDTMIASQFVGEKEPGLAAVLNKRFGIVLNKKYQKADWSKRPLGRDMIMYAAHDTAHLIGLCRELKRELMSKGRLGWLEEECRILSDECAPAGGPGLTAGQGNAQEGRGWADRSGSIEVPLEPAPMFTRFKGAGKMDPGDLAVLENLLVFRERRAMREDRPPFKLFGTKVIMELVKTKPTSLEKLMATPGLPSVFGKRYAAAVLQAVRRALDMPASRLPAYPRGRRHRPDPQKKARLARLKDWRQERAARLELDPGLVCNNALLDAIAGADPKDLSGLKSIPRIRDWQMKAFGQELIDVLQGGS